MDGIKPGENVEVVGGDAKQVDTCVCWPYYGQTLPPGTRVDLTCKLCGRRVCADKHTERFAAAGAEVVCAPCAEVTGLVKAE